MATQRPSSSTSKVSKKRKRDHSSSPHWKHEVFLSFYGKDTRKGFTSHLHDALKRKGILVFKDDETLKQGEYISEALQKAIQKSQYVIVILSANYASSKWCLMELAEIVEWEEKTKLITIIPIFYHVDPSDVRNQRGTFAKAFAAHEKAPKVILPEIDMWKKAFSKVGNITGEHIHDRCESTIIQKVCGRISKELNSRFSRHDYDKLVAIDSHVDEMMKLLDMESNDVRFVGIHGMGGVGKTTLAQIIYDRVFNSNCRFEGSNFISCIREKSTTARDLASLQKELLSTIMQEKIHVWDHHQGIKVIRSMLRNKKVFIVLDGVDSEKQLMALWSHDWFGPGSRVIITCRDSHLLKTHGVNDIYKVEQLETTEALQLFSLSAFEQTHPRDNYKDLSMDFVNYAQGLPLALKVLGSFLFGRTIDAWTSERDKLKPIPNPEIMDVLQISFDGLQDLQKELFLDMACFYGGHEHIFSEMLLERFGHYRIDLDVLVEKSLLSKSYKGTLIMHDLLKELGREIVRRECPEEPGRRSRLFRVEDLYHVLKNDTGTDATKAMVVDFCPETKVRRLNGKALSKMRKLRCFKFHQSRTLKWHGKPLKYMPTNELRYLEWPGYHSKYLPSNFQPENLTVLRMPGSRIKQLWKGSMVLDNLKVFDLSYSENLIEIPDLTGVPNLERVYLEGCRSLCEVHPSIGSLKQLNELQLDKCTSLEKLPDLSNLECLTDLWAEETAITQIPSVNLMPKSIRRFHLQGCKSMRLKSRDPIFDIGSLVEYQKEGIYDYVEAAYIDFDSKGENILDMAGGVVSALDDDLKMIRGWSLGFHIPEWV
ncbi:disease resistance protein RUN1-like [Juglans regia]|uniref:Disease resistance protein RUN1-like n=2 Tax=Juglans regia TaxID=51240 RepID=A0A6P9E6I9_JUGRE|nr:disease resistance protein RUN1-like [Juglans regia]